MSRQPQYVVDRGVSKLWITCGNDSS